MGAVQESQTTSYQAQLLIGKVQKGQVFALCIDNFAKALGSLLELPSSKECRQSLEGIVEAAQHHGNLATGNHVDQK
jgi:hypothetical protein